MRSKGKDSSAARRPPFSTDHFTYPRKVNPFIVMKWGGIMYWECEMLNPVLAFLWERSSPADMENRDLERNSDYHSKHDADIAQHTLKEICMCVHVSRQTPHVSAALSCTRHCVALDPHSGGGCATVGLMEIQPSQNKSMEILCFCCHLWKHIRLDMCPLLCSLLEVVCVVAIILRGVTYPVWSCLHTEYSKHLY